MTRVAVLGAGVMGSNHVRVAASARDVELVAVVDADLERARAAAAVAPDAVALSSVTELLDLPDDRRPEAAVLAVPTPAHEEVATALVGAGVHVLVEKPLGPDEEACRRIALAAEEAGCVLMVGHIERFNPVCQEIHRLYAGQPVHVRTTRVGPFSSRIGDGVVLDLMIHDLDLACWMVGSEVVEVEAVSNRIHSDREDLASVVLRFASGATASLLASRAGQHKIRSIELTLPDAYVTADLLRQDLEISRVEHTEYLSSSGVTYRQSGVVERPFLTQRGEPLALEMDAFLAAVRDGATVPVSAADGTAAVALVKRVLDATGRSA